MTDVESQLIKIAAGVESLNNRFDASERRQESMHQENARRMDVLTGVVNKAHERISVFEAIQSGLQAEMTKVRERYHELGKWLQMQVSVTGSQVTLSGDDKPVSRMELKWLIAWGVGSLMAGAGVTVFVFKLAGKL